jgi:hypothetical protein
MNPISKALVAVVVAGPAMLGCGAQGSLVAGVPGLPADFTGPGTYTIPAVPAAPFPFSKVHLEQSSGTVGVYYELPAAFPVRSPDVALSGTADGTETVALEGPAGTSTCTLSAGIFECHEVLTGLHFDPQDLPASDPESAAVASFIVDPIGVLRVALPQ